MYYVSNVDIYNGVNKVWSQSLNGNKQFGQHLLLSSVLFQTIFRLKKGNTVQLGPTRKFSWKTMMDRSIFYSLMEV